MTRLTHILLLAGLDFSASVGSASAHSISRDGGFVAGFTHPFTGFDHLLAMVSVGIWGAFLGKPLIYALPIAFPLMMVVGTGFGISNLSLPATQLCIALSVACLGACIAAAWKAPIWAALPLVGFFAFFHGYAHGSEMPYASNAFTFSAGFVLATGMLHLAGISIGALSTGAIACTVTRVSGAAICGLGVFWATQIARC